MLHKRQSITIASEELLHTAKEIDVVLQKEIYKVSAFINVSKKHFREYIIQMQKRVLSDY